VTEAPRGPWSATLHDLALRPGAITRAVLDGQGGEYLPLGRLLVILVAVFFALTLLQPRAAGGPSAEVAAACGGAGGSTDLGLLLGAAGAPEATANAPIAAGVLHFAGEVLCDPQRFTRAFSLAIPLGFLLLMPLSAGLMQLAFRKDMPGFAANWAYGLEAHAALFLLLIVLVVVSLVGPGWLSFLASVAGLFYASWNVLAGVERAYRVSGRTAAWRTTGVGVVYAVALTVVSTLLFLALFGR
jgi:hypothetical protein